ncbi:CPBP family intramembrane glutamic endopeptidase [Dyella psychrodurans]|uniref:CPBP family intramembrane metalloprotease n=1 Tax=Dyella psychrodurans TaxID=1927960 RepID=A0A370XB54_9GAMM|nr:type II CAAX endopeptidase family protein [Dyella psychrodurans]RDS85532.1 CPBP family intramembrane metalloprotease [Dyella psychrodurans]
MPISPTKPGKPASTAVSERAPGVMYALGLVVLYFVLQATAGALVSFLTGVFERYRHPDLSRAQVHQHVMTLLQRPDSNALLMIVALPLIALVMLGFVHRRWPALWMLSRPPGFGFTGARSASWYILALLIGVMMPPLGGLLTQLAAHGHALSQNVEDISRHASWNLRLPLGIVIVTVGPLIEELMFRGVLLSALMHRLSTGMSVAICAVLFGVVHLGGLDFQWYALPNLILLAAVLCWLRLKSASLWPAIIAHGIYNLFALIALLATTTADS